MLYVKPGATYYVTVDNAPTGLTGQIGWRLEDVDNDIVQVRTTAGTQEFAKGAYRKELVAPLFAATFYAIADFPDTTEVVEEVVVTATAPAPDVGDARDQLAEMVAATTEPTLDSGELDSLLALAQRPDDEGRLPDDGEWEPTWDLNAAAAEGWRRKAGKAAPVGNRQVDNQRIELQGVYAHCLSQAEAYAQLVAPIPLVR
jgi:hypothetical protein